MKRKYEFSIATCYIGSMHCEEIEIDIPDDMSEYEIEEFVQEQYNDWLANNNFGGYKEIN